MKKLSTVVYACCCWSRWSSAPFVGAYPVFVMKLMCFALFAAAFNLLLGYTGLLSFGHAAFLGGSAYVAGHADQGLGPHARTGPARRHRSLAPSWAGSSACWPFAARASTSR